MSGNKTLFVRNLPFSITKDKLEDHFSEYGPLKQCFIVSDRETGKSRGFGYVQYTVREDAVKALETKNVIEGRKVLVDFADITKKKGRERKKKGEGGDDDYIDKEMDIEIKQEKDDEHQSDKKGKNQSDMKYHKAKIVVVSGLPAGMTEGALTICLQKLNVKSVAEVKTMPENSAHVKFKCIRDAKRAIRKLHNHAYKDCLLQASQLSRDPENVPQNQVKRSRVIVRNLSFQCKEEDLVKAFSECGEITDVKIPKNNDGRSLGFGFVQFISLQDAMKAINGMNSQKIQGRPVAVDWALPKNRYEAQQTGETEEDDAASDEGSFSGESDLSDDDRTGKGKKKPKVKVEPLDSDDEVPVKTGKKVKVKTEAVDNDEGFKDDEDDSDEDDVDDEDDEEEEEEEEDDDEDDDSEDDSDMEESDDKKKKLSIKKAPAKSDVDEGCTLFIRNLSFDSEEEGVVECFEKFGEVQYAKIVVDHNTEHSRGMAFIKFKKKESADACLEEVASNSITLDSRELNITRAVSRDQSSKFNEKKTKEKKDNRNLHLAREGMIRPGTQAAEGLTKADLDKRAKVDEVKRQKLKNINIFISPLRLCVRNIPVSVDEKQLKAAFRKAANNPAAKVTESRIMRDLARKNSAGVGKSHGFGFVSFTEHTHALNALRNTNNNPDIFGENKRLIVEFSLENRKALESKVRRKERFLAKREQLKANQSTEESTHKKPIGKGQKVGPIPLLHMSEKDKKMKGHNMGPKGLPSHWGPKVRHNKRPSQTQQGQTGKKKKAQHHGPGGSNKRPMGDGAPPQAQKRANTDTTQGPVQKKSRRRNKYESDKFDQLVNRYKNKFMEKKMDKKWFD